MNPLKNYGPALVIAGAFIVSAWMMMPGPQTTLKVDPIVFVGEPVADVEPENEIERRLFRRVDQRVEAKAGGLVASALNNVLDEAEKQMPSMMMGAEPRPQGIFSVLGSKLVALIVKIAKWVVEIVVGAAILALAYKFWPWLVGGFIACVTLVATPAGWAAGKATK